MHPKMTELRDYLDASGPGAIPNIDDLVALLTPLWPTLVGSDAEAMATRKLGRMEDPVWKPPLLRFRIERHGGTVLGSTRAAMQTWTVDLAKCTAAVVEDGHRQLRPQAPRLTVQPLVEELIQLIASGANDRRLTWSPDRTSVRVRIGEVIPSAGAQQTVAGRRRRLRENLDPAIIAIGWQPGAARWTYVRDPGLT